ncbi:Gfo/Idh/MocA family oxidoreductase [Peribacillus frigoritolerans]|nr:Gfo/Idh/MocA family oxidoreductase [Peribacillus frigoritolerans]
MFQAEQPDIVSVCTPNRYHYENVIKALEYGCHVMCKKPPAISAVEAKHMYEVANESNLILAYNFHHRFADDVNILRKKSDRRCAGGYLCRKSKSPAPQRCTWVGGDFMK